MSEESILTIILICVNLIVGAGGIFALVRFLYKSKKDSKKYFVRCTLAAEFLKQDIVEMKPEKAKQLFIDILEGKLEEPKEKEKVANKVIKIAKESAKK